MRRVIYRWLHITLPLGLLLGIIGWRASGSALVEAVHLKAFDGWIRAKPRVYQDAGVRIIDIDDESLARLGQWPWPRSLLAQLVDRLGEGGAAAIALDILFSEADRFSPSNDVALARATARWPVVLGMALTQQPLPPRPFRAASVGSRGEVSEFGVAVSGALVNIAALERAASGAGAITTAFERDAVIRRVPILWSLENQEVPLLAAEALRVAQGAKTYVVRGSQRDLGKDVREGIGSIAVGQFNIPTDRNGRFWLYPTPRAAQRVIPAWKVLESKLEGGALEGCIAFVGTSAEGLKDLRATALDPVSPGVEVHANVAEQIILGQALKRPYWTEAEIGYMALLGLLLIFLLPRLGAAWCLPVAAAGVAGPLAISWYLFSAKGYLIDWVFPAAATLIVYMASSIISYLKSEAEKRQVRGAFSRYLAPALVEQLARHPEKLKLGGETREMTFHFCDIRGFTTISEHFDPHGLTQFINRFLTPMTEIILAHGGVIDKYMGDCIMAFWNAPLDDRDHARHGCAAALAMHQKLAALNEEWKAQAQAQGRPFIRVEIGTGLNTGSCVVGNMGSDQRFDYSVLGDAVNLASRLEGQSKYYGVPIVIGEGTRKQAPEFASLELDLIKVKGKTVPVRVYALLGGPKLAQAPEFKEQARRHQLLLDAYRARRWQEARERLAECRAAGAGLDRLYDLYAQRLDSLDAAPPAADWDGTYTATSK